MTDRLLADTNIIIYALKGLPHVRKLLDKRSVFVSFVTEVELLSYSKNTREDLFIIDEFLQNSHIVEYSIPIKKMAIEIRRKYKLQLADSFIAASAVEFGLPLISADPVFDRISELNFFHVDINN